MSWEQERIENLEFLLNKNHKTVLNLRKIIDAQRKEIARLTGLDQDEDKTVKIETILESRQLNDLHEI